MYFEAILCPGHTALVYFMLFKVNSCSNVIFLLKVYFDFRLLHTFGVTSIYAAWHIGIALLSSHLFLFQKISQTWLDGFNSNLACGCNQFSRCALF